MNSVELQQKFLYETEQTLTGHHLFPASIHGLPGKTTEPKFQVLTSDGSYFVKFSPLGQFAPPIMELLALAQKETGSLNLPIISEIRTDLNYQVNVYPWLDGMDLKAWSATATHEECYCQGEQCGELLKSIHKVTATSKPQNFNIASHMIENIDVIARNGIRLPAIEKLVTEPSVYISALQRDGPAALVHFDFKPKNIMHTRGRNVVVDWDSSAIADPWLDFWDKGISLHPKREAFSTGMLDGYFEHNVPSAFWEYFHALSLFACLQSAVWAIKRKDISHISLLNDYLFTSYQDFKKIVPVWYETNHQ